MSRPGDRLRAFAAWWCDERTLALVVDPAVADLQHEPSVRHYIAVLKLLVVCAARETIVDDSSRQASELTALGRTLTWSGCLVTLLTAAMVKLSDRITPLVLHPDPMRYVYMIPGALVVTMTFGIALGVVIALAGRRISRRVAALVLMLSVAASAASFVNLGWLAPASNQAFRILMSGQASPDPGIPELSLGELVQKIDSFSDPVYSKFGYLHALSFNYYTRLAMTFGPVVFTIFGLSLALAIRSRWIPLAGAVVACMLYWMAINARGLMPWNSGLSPFAAAWVANAAVLAAAALAWCAHMWRSRSEINLPV